MRIREGWVLPHALERAATTGDEPTPRWTLVGNVGSPGKAAVDRRGLVTPAGAAWSLDWWVGADDRWHLPSREAAVRQRRLGSAPVIETAMRVPSGDAVQRVYGARAGTLDSIVVDVENASPVPFALALVVRPFLPAGIGTVGEIALTGNTVSVDGVPALLLPRPPSLVSRSTGAEGDVADAVLGGHAALSAAWPVVDREGAASAAFVFPVPHRTRLRVALAPHAAPDFDVARLPAADDVVASWDAMLRHGARVVLPDARVQGAVDAARSSLVLFDDGRAIRPTPVVGGARPADAVAVVAALEAWGLDRHVEEARRSLPRRWRRRHRPGPVTDAPGVVRQLLASAEDTVAWPRGDEGHHGGATAEFLLAVRQLLIAETPEGISVLPEFPPEWEGHEIEVHGMPVTGGALSYAVRWHGSRPALLWESSARPGTRLTAPGLDPTWSTTEARGEDLLRVAGGSPAGLPPHGA